MTGDPIRSISTAYLPGTEEAAKMIDALRTDDELRRAVEWCRDRAEFADCAGTCGRTLATCRQHGDLPIYLHETEGPYCAICWEATDMSNINWGEEIDGKPLWRLAAELYDNGRTWPEVAEVLQERHGRTVDPDNIARNVNRRRGSASDLDFDEDLDGKPLWQVALELYDPSIEMTWPRVTDVLRGMTTQEIPHWRTICEGVKKRAEAAQTPAPPAAEETPAPTPAAPPAPAQAQRVALEGSICIVRGGVSIDVFGDDFAEVREVAICVLGGLDAA